MGDFLTTPNKEKVSEDNECPTVKILLIVVKIWRIWYAGVEKKNGGFPHFRYEYWKR